MCFTKKLNYSLILENNLNAATDEEALKPFDLLLSIFDMNNTEFCFPSYFIMLYCFIIGLQNEFT